MAKESLASKAKARVETQTTEAIAAPEPILPAEFMATADGQAMAESIEVGESNFNISPYMVFASERSPNFNMWAAHVPDLSEGQPILVRRGAEGPTYDRLSPCKFHLIAGFQHFSELTDRGDFVRTTLDARVAKEDEAGTLRECIETVLLVYAPGGGLVCARCTFKTTKCGAARTAIETLRLAKDAAKWGARSPAHKASLVAQVPWARFAVVVKLKSGTGKDSGRDYIAANAVIVPSALAEWEAIGAFLKVEENQRACREAMDAHKSRVERIKSLVEG